LNVLCLCTGEWKCDESKGVKLAKTGVDTCVWPLYEVENGTYELNCKPKEKKSILEWIKTQGRFCHLFKKENAWIPEEFQKKVDMEWEELNRLASL
jgi:pyruvate ferredoxin oxidoreductase beta subunit